MFNWKFLLTLAVICLKIEDINSLAVKERNDSLVLLHVLFRHGNRTPDIVEVYPKDPHIAHFKEEFGILTNDGKYREYLIGTALRQRYNDFLGEFTLNSVIATTTDYDRTKMSCELVLAGLYPPTPEQKWNEYLNWQPIPYNYKSMAEDHLLMDPKLNCPEFLKNYYLYLNSSHGSMFSTKNKQLYEYLSLKTGWTVDSPRKAYDLSFLLIIEENLGLILPEWTKMIWPKLLVEAAVEQYYVDTATTKLKKLSGGALIKKIVEDTRLKLMGKLPSDRKIFLYSAHENNIAYLLILLKVFYPHIPPFGSYVTIEVHKIHGMYGFTILYQDYTTNEPRELIIPDCGVFCPFDKFVELVEQYFPTYEDVCHK